MIHLDQSGDHYDAVLAEMLLSRKVGVSHIRHLGDLISARAQLSMGMQGAVGLSFDQRADIVEAVIELEDSYISAWNSISNELRIDRQGRNLQKLEQALRDAVAGIREIARRNGIRIE
ncbi:hypothetical protein ACVNF4_01055 [Streptomyces sp. S6]